MWKAVTTTVSAVLTETASGSEALMVPDATALPLIVIGRSRDRRRLPYGSAAVSNGTRKRIAGGARRNASRLRTVETNSAGGRHCRIVRMMLTRYVFVVTPSWAVPRWCWQHCC